MSKSKKKQKELNAKNNTGVNVRNKFLSIIPDNPNKPKKAIKPLDAEDEKPGGCVSIIAYIIMAIFSILILNKCEKSDNDNGMSLEQKVLLEMMEEFDIKPITAPEFNPKLVFDINTKYDNIIIKGLKDFNPIYDYYDVVNYLEVFNFKYKHLNISETQSLFSVMGLNSILVDGDTGVKGSVYLYRNSYYYIGLDLYRKSFTNTELDTLYIEVYETIAMDDIMDRVLFNYALVEEKSEGAIEQLPTFIFNRNEFRLYTYETNKGLVGYRYKF